MGVHGSSWVGLRGFFYPIHYGGSKKIKNKIKKDKVAQQNGTVDVQHKNIGCIVQKHCMRIRAFIYIRKKSTNR